MLAAIVLSATGERKARFQPQRRRVRVVSSEPSLNERRSTPIWPSGRAGRATNTAVVATADS